MNLARGLQVLRAFGPDDLILGNRDIADRTGLPKATVSRLTYTLLLLGYLSQAPRQKFRLGPGLLSLGYPLLVGFGVRAVARPILEALARETRCTANLGMRDRTNVVYVESVRMDSGNPHRPDIGSSRPLLSTAIGRALILSSTPTERSAILNRIRLDDPDRYAANKLAYDADESRLRELGYCRSFGDWDRDMHAVAVPLPSLAQNEILAINCTMSTARMRDGQLENEVVPRLIEAARRISHVGGLH